MGFGSLMDFRLDYETINKIEFLISQKLLEKYSILASFTSREKGVSPPPYNSLNLGFKAGDDPQIVIKNRELVCDCLKLDFERLTTAKQIHSDGTVLVTPELIGRGKASEETAIPQTDALITNLRKVPLALFFADCVPIILVDPINKAAGIIHAGWQGALAEIAAKTFLQMQKNFHSQPQEILVFLGPSIGPCCYQVDEERADRFRKKFPGALADKNSVNLEEANKLTLERLGIPPKNFYSAGTCTSCRNDLFFSYRKEKITGRQAALVCIL